MKKLWLGLLATILVVVFVAPSFAWEFSMTGEYEFRYRYLGRANGSKDLFGDMNYQNSVLNQGNGGELIGFAGPNFYRGFNGNNAAPMLTSWWGNQIAIVKGGFSYADSDAYANDQRMTFVPSIKVNNAVRVHGAFDLASIRQRYNHRDFQTNGPLDRWYQDRQSGNGTDTAMIPSISQWRMTAQLPWGVLSIGAKDFPFGTGSLLGYNTRASALLFVLPYGPFRILPSIWLARNPDGFGAFAPYGAGTGPAADSVNDYDGGKHNQIFWSTVFTYENCGLSLGGGFVHQITHLDAAYATGLRPTQNAWDAAPVVWGFRGRDNTLIFWTMFAKYNNGRFFVNAEYDFANAQSTFLGAGAGLVPGSTMSGAPEISTEVAQAFLELGALCGPAKLAGMFAWSGGPVLNNYNATKGYQGLAINNQATDAYNYLMFHTYGGGNNSPWQSGAVSFTNDENGMMSDAYCLAARVDYAAAANLNMWGSYMWAHRVEQNGFYAGGRSQFGTAGTSSVATAQAWRATHMGGGGNQNPYVDDGYLGWEANLGVNWKLLENFAVNSRYAYWQPGQWFNEAYQVVGFSNGVASTPGATTGAYLGDRSAIQAFECSVLVDF